MPQLANKVVITCAVTGSIHTPTMSDALPITPDEIATQAIDAAKAGAAISKATANAPSYDDEDDEDEEGEDGDQRLSRAERRRLKKLARRDGQRRAA